MKRLILSALLFIMATTAFADSSICYVAYQRTFVINSLAQLPPLKIMSVTPASGQPNLVSVQVLSDNTLRISGMPDYDCGKSEGSVSRKDIVVPVRVGYDDAHYADLLIFVHMKFFYPDAQTTIIQTNPPTKGIILVGVPTSSTRFGTFNILLAKQEK